MSNEEIISSPVETATERLDRLGIYGEIKRELVKRGIPATEIAFVHDFDTPAKKAQAFADTNAGKIRIMLASTEKAGTGVNMQERLYALHHLDAPWRPADVEQREGRILRQGNRYEEVRIFNYVTENSFDGYMWQTLENKARFIAQIMTGEVTARSAEDVDDLVMTAAQVKAIASGNPRILERVSIEVELARLSRLYSVWRQSRHHLKWEAQGLPQRVQEADERIAAHTQALALREQSADVAFSIKLHCAMESDEVLTFTQRTEASAQLERLRRQINAHPRLPQQRLGSYRGFDLLAQTQRNREEAFFTPVEAWFAVPGSNRLYEFKFGDAASSALQSLDAQLRSLDSHLQRAVRAQKELHHRQAQITAELHKGWEYAPAYEALQQQLQVVNQALAADGSAVGETANFAALDAEALRACETTSSVVPLAPVIVEAVPTSPPTFVAPDLTPPAATPAAIVAAFLPAEPTRLTLEELRQQVHVPVNRKATRTATAAQMNLW